MMKHLWVYLLSIPFRVFPKHQALKHAYKVGRHHPRVQRWLELRNVYQFNLRYRSSIASSNETSFRACRWMPSSPTSTVPVGSLTIRMLTFTSWVLPGSRLVSRTPITLRALRTLPLFLSRVGPMPQPGHEDGRGTHSASRSPC